VADLPVEKNIYFYNGSHLVCSFESFKMNHQVNKENAKRDFLRLIGTIGTVKSPLLPFLKSLGNGFEK